MNDPHKMPDVVGMCKEYHAEGVAVVMHIGNGVYVWRSTGLSSEQLNMVAAIISSDMVQSITDPVPAVLS